MLESFNIVVDYSENPTCSHIWVPVCPTFTPDLARFQDVFGYTACILCKTIGHITGPKDQEEEDDSNTNQN